MSTATAVLNNPSIARTSAHTATIYLKEAKYEFLKNLRGQPTVVVSSRLQFVLQIRRQRRGTALEFVVWHGLARQVEPGRQRLQAVSLGVRVDRVRQG